MALRSRMPQALPTPYQTTSGWQPRCLRKIAPQTARSPATRRGKEPRNAPRAQHSKCVKKLLAVRAGALPVGAKGASEQGRQNPGPFAIATLVTRTLI